MELMLILEYFGYVILYGYIVFGFVYIVSKIILRLQNHSLFEIELWYTDTLDNSLATSIDNIFNELGIKQID